jgi:Ca-activated chloride channel family protein
MQFARPEYLNLLWALPALVLFFLWSFRARRKKLAKIISLSLAPRLTEHFSRSKAILRTLFLTGFFLFGILAAARPQWGARLDTVRRHGVDLIAALDTSYSMNTEDIAPNRLEKAKEEIRKLVQKSEDDRIGLVTFSGAAFVQCPLTLDHGAIDLFLDVAGTGMLPEPGTSLAAAIDTATSAFVEKERKYKVLVLFTDGEDLEGQVDKAVRKAREAGVVIYTVGIGTPQGKPIPIRDSKGDVIEYRKDPEGQIVISSLDEKSLASIASQTGGSFFRATTSEAEIDALTKDISGLEKKEFESRLFQNFEDRFQYPLALAILFLFAALWISERRKPGSAWFHGRGIWGRTGRLTAMLTLALALVIPQHARAESPASKNNKGNRLFNQGKFEEAEKAYIAAQGDDPGKPEILYNLGNSLIKQKKYQEGVRSLAQSMGKGDKAIKEKGWYNTGDALFAMGNYKDAADSFIQALRMDPHDMDAKHNLELALLKLKQQEQQNSASGQQQKSSKDSRASQSQQNKGAQQGQQSPQPPPEKKKESLSRERALQLLDAMKDQEKEEQRKLAEHQARSTSGTKDW